MISKQLHSRVQFIPFVLLRWIRFAIPLVGVIVLHKCASLTGSGPFYHQRILDQSVMTGCEDHQWWKGLLFIQNWFNLSITVFYLNYKSKIKLIQSIFKVHTNQLVRISWSTNPHHSLYSDHNIETKSISTSFTLLLYNDRNIDTCSNHTALDWNTNLFQHEFVCQ